MTLTAVSRERRQGDADIATGRRGNVIPGVDASRDRFLQSRDGARQRFVAVAAERRQLREVGRGGQYGAVVVLESDRIG